MENLETPIKAIRRLAKKDIENVHGVNRNIARWIVDDLLSEQGEKDLLAGVNQEGMTRRHQLIAPLNGYEFRIFGSCASNSHIVLDNLPAVISERYTPTSEGKLLETLEWCFVMSSIIRGSGRENSFAVRKMLAEDFVRMIAFYPNNPTDNRTTTRCQVVRSFWKSFLHEAARDPTTSEAEKDVKKLAKDVISLYEKSDGLHTLEIGSLLAEIMPYLAEEERSRARKLLRRDRENFQKNNVKTVMNLLGFEDFFRHLEERGRPRKRQR